MGLFSFSLESRIENFEEEATEIEEALDARANRLAQEADQLDSLRGRFDRLVG